MITLLKHWNGPVEINGTKFSTISEALDNCKEFPENINIKLYPKNKVENTKVTTNDNITYKITVKTYMTKKSTPSFDFMEKWNNDIPMPLRTMVGEKIRETRGMVYMKLHADILSEKTLTCMKCGKPITNSISQYFGMGPECGGHNYVNPFNNEEELKIAVDKYRKQLQNIKWEGWIIKSAIEEEEKLE